MHGKYINQSINQLCNHICGAPTKARLFCTNQFHKSHHLRITKNDFWLILKHFKKQ